MKIAWILNAVVMTVLLVALGTGTRSMVQAAAHRLETGESLEGQKKPAPLIASKAEVAYCTDELKTVLRRVLTNCGLIGGGRRGCQPNELRNVAQISDADFNTLFKSLDKRAGIILFDPEKDELDAGSKALLEKMWADQRGASYFFVVARASTDDTTEKNRMYSHKRANSVLFYLQERFKDTELDQKLGLLWLGEEYAQLDKEFCSWNLSRPVDECQKEQRTKAEDLQMSKELNRSAVISWIDCRL
jgi:outer membrane protein OmpA-like peptidoglycan-associated protein